MKKLKIKLKHAWWEVLDVIYIIPNWFFIWRHFK